MRRDLQGVEARLQRSLERAPPDFREFLVNYGVTTNRDGQVVLSGVTADETFEEMRLRITRRLQIPTWPGVAGGVLGLTFLLLAIPARESKKES